ILGLSEQLGFVANTLALILLIILTPFAGHLSDKYGRKPLLLFATVGTLILVYPLFLLMNTVSFPLIVVAVLIFAVLIASFNGPAVVTLVELFPADVRYSSFSIGYNLTISLFGGTAPLISTYLVKATGFNMAPLFYIAFAAIVSTITLLIINFDTFRIKAEQQAKKVIQAQAK